MGANSLNYVVILKKDHSEVERGMFDAIRTTLSDLKIGVISVTYTDKETFKSVGETVKNCVIFMDQDHSGDDSDVKKDALLSEYVRGSIIAEVEDGEDYLTKALDTTLYISNLMSV